MLFFRWYLTFFPLQFCLFPAMILREMLGYACKKAYLCTDKRQERIRRDARVVEWTALEMRRAGDCTLGSNPSLSATAGRATL